MGAAAANAAGIGLPFALAWAFYFGATFSDLVNAASPFLNGAVQFIVPALLFAAYMRRDGGGGVAREGRSVSLMGLEASTGWWRVVALAVAGGAGALVAATYALNAAVSAGDIAPRAERHAGAAAAADYS